MPSTLTRWCPTPEQLMILEEIYRRGTRTPHANQIQQITAHLSLYGKIQGKNVFYWFQNHKARDRRRMGRKIINKRHHHYQHHHQHHNNNNILHRFTQSPPCSAANYASPKINNAGVFVSQGGIFGSPPTQMTMNHHNKWKMDVPEKIIEMDKSSSAKMSGGDWTMMMLDIGSSSSISTTVCCTHPPLKTLQLFPTTPSNLKE